MTQQELQQIAAERGLSHAEFCVEQEPTPSDPLFVELDRLQQEEWQANLASLAGVEIQL